MAKFTLVDNTTVVSAVVMRFDGEQDSKRLRLHDVGADEKVLQLNSTKAAVATATLKGAFDHRKGIWTISLSAKSKGTADIEAKLKGATVAKLAVTVTEQMVLPAAAGEEGMLVRLFLAENLSPSQPKYNAADSRKSMEWMRVVLVNRLKNNPERFAASGATTITDIVKAKGQFAGFENYPTLGSKLSARIEEAVKIANNDSDARQEKYVQFLQNALDAAKGSPIADPCPTGLYGWRTVGHGSPGGNFEAYGSALSGNQFYTLKKKEEKKESKEKK